jgi:N-acetylmuramoyl-L-alanine amidase
LVSVTPVSVYGMTSARTLRKVACFAALGLALAVSSRRLFSSPADEKRISVYSLVANYSLPVVERGGQDYTGLLEALEPLGNVSATTEGSHWRLRYNNQRADFTAGSNRGDVGRTNFDLHGDFLLENGRGLVPLSSLGPLLERILGGPVTFHEASRRVFIGSVAVHFTAQINPGTAHSLVMNFTSPVNPRISTEPGKLQMLFSHEPVVAPGSMSLTFDDKVIPSASYAEENGTAELTVNGNVPLFATFSNGNHTITISPAPLAAGQAPAPAPRSALSAGAAAPSPVPPPVAAAPAAPPAPVQFFAVVDASHGGAERGEALTDQLAEKDITLAFARALRGELEARGINTLMLRDGDATMGPDQRASLANVASPAIYICLHASSQGHGVRLYTALLPLGGSDVGPFLSWDTAQSPFLSLSQAVASSLALELETKQVPVRVLLAPQRPLNNITAAAIAVEVAPPSTGIADLNSPAYQHLVAESVATGVLSVRSKLEAGR